MKTELFLKLTRITLDQVEAKIRKRSYKKCILLGIMVLFCLFSTNQKVLAQAQTTDQIHYIGLPRVPGLMSRDPSGQVKGLPLELFEAIAHDEQIQFEWVEGSWNELYQQLQARAIDMLPGTQETPERQASLDFTTSSIYSMWSELYLNKKKRFNSIIELDRQKIGLVRDDNNALGFEKYIAAFDIQFIPVYFSSHAEALLSLERQEIYAMAGPSPNLLGELPPHIVSSGLHFNPVELKYAFPGGQHLQLQKQIDSRLITYKKDPNSIYYQLRKKYDQARFETAKWHMPIWMQIALPLALLLLASTTLFIIMLKREVTFQTKELKSRETFLRKAIEVGEMGIWQFDVVKDLVYWSEEVYNFTGIPKEKDYLTFEDIRKIIHPDDLEEIRAFLGSIKSNEAFEKECRIINPQKQIIYLRLIGQFIPNEKESQHLATGIIQNISNQKLYEQELIQAKEKAERNEKLKSSFLANMSHEIRTPLNSIVGFSHLIATEEIDDLRKKDYRKIILKQNEVLLTLINDIIDISKIESGSIEIRFGDTNIRELILGIFENHKNTCPDNIDFQLDFQLNETSYQIYTDRTRLEQIINNLVSNAFKYTPEGRVVIGCRLSDKPGYFDVFVKDTGIGISQEDQSMLFLRFNQLNNLKQGTGLGLAISQSLAILLNSRIIVISEEGKGSEFYLSFPFQAEKSQEAVPNFQSEA